LNLTGAYTWLSLHFFFSPFSLIFYHKRKSTLELDKCIQALYGIHNLSYNTGAFKMNTQKVAITMPADLVKIVDEVSRQKGISRSKYISVVLRERLLSDREKQIRETYDRIFSDVLIRKEQLETAVWFDKAEEKEGQEW